MLSPEDQWKFALGSFIYEFAKLEAYVFRQCAAIISPDDTRKLTFGKRLDRIKAQLKQQLPGQCEPTLVLLRQARGMSKFRNHLLHNTEFHGGESPQLGELQATLQQLERLLRELGVPL
ncbi:MAG TPA: hypothetical protein VGF27_05885 [Pseudoduganella sp.]